MAGDTLSYAVVAGTGVAAAAATILYARAVGKEVQGLKPISKAPKAPGGVLGPLKQLTSPDVHRWLTKWAEELGPVYTISMLGAPVLVITDPDLTRPLMTRGEFELPKYGVVYNPTNQLGTPEKKPGLFTLTHETPYYSAIRKAVMPAFATSNISKQYNALRDKALQLCDTLAKAAVPGQEMDVTPYVVAAVFDAMGESLFAIRFNALQDPTNNTFLQAVKRGTRELSARVTDPLRETLQTVLWFLPSSRKVAQDFESGYGVYREVVRQMRSRAPYAETDQTLAACLMRVTNPQTKKPLTDLELQANVSAFLVGGLDTSSTCILWALYNITRHPDVYTRLESELRTAGLITQEGKPGRLPEWSDLTSLPYFNAVLKESMRLHNVAGCTATFRVTEAPMQIGEYWVPKGTPVWIPLYSLSNTSANFPDPHTFKPERWLSSTDGKASQPDWTALVFSSGTRSCPGQNQGITQVRAILLVLLCRLRFVLGPSLSDPATVDAAQTMALVVTNSKGNQYIVTPR